MQKQTGGPAFPEPGNVGYNSEWQNEPGMTMRDYFAAKAMQSALLTSQPENPLGRIDIYAQAVAELSYEMADAMLHAREKS